MQIKKKRKKRYRRHKRVRGKVFGTAKKPRLYVFRSNRHIYAQLIDDEKGKVLAFSSDEKLKVKKEKKRSTPVSAKATAGKERKKEIPKTKKLALGFEVGKLIAQKAKDLKIEEVIFDRGGYKYHGRVKSLADGARGGGLKF